MIYEQIAKEYVPLIKSKSKGKKNGLTESLKELKGE